MWDCQMADRKVDQRVVWKAEWKVPLWVAMMVEHWAVQ
jgi:hypothetical protein